MLNTSFLTDNKLTPQSELSPFLAVTAKLFTPSYSSKEDRIRLVINYDDYAQRVDFWITRSFLLKLLPSWEEFFYKHAGTPEMGIGSIPTSKNSNVTNTSTKSNIPNASKTDIHTLELTQKEGILLESVDMQFNRAKNLFNITLKGTNIKVSASLAPPMMIGILRSIYRSAPHMNWGISPALLG